METRVGLVLVCITSGPWLQPPGVGVGGREPPSNPCGHWDLGPHSLSSVIPSSLLTGL